MNSSYTEKLSIGALYDGETFEKVANLQDFKFLNTTTVLRQRVSSFYDIGLSRIQYYYALRMEEVDSNESSIETLFRYDLTNIGNFNKIYFDYDGRYTSVFSGFGYCAVDYFKVHSSL